MKALVITVREELLQAIRRELPSLVLLESPFAMEEFRRDGLVPEVLLIDNPAPEELSRIEGLLPAEIPLVILDSSGQAADSPLLLPQGRAGALLREPWSWEEIKAALILARRGGRYLDGGGSGQNRSGTAEVGDEYLSPREVEVLRKLAEGWTNRGIAGTLGISENTVKYHLSGIFRKLGAESRTEAIVLAAQRGLLAL